MASRSSEPASPPAPPEPESELDRAIARLQQLCATAPEGAEPRLELTRLLLQADRPAEAVIPAEQALALAPGLELARRQREAVLAAIHARDPELVKPELFAALNPGDGGAQLVLGETYAALGRTRDAERALERALQLGRAGEANADLAALHLAAGRLETATAHAQAALASATGSNRNVAAMAHQTLAAVARARGDDVLAERHFDQAYGQRSFFHQPAPLSPFRALVLVSRRQGNLPYKTLLPPVRFDCTAWYMEHARPQDVAELPPFDLVLNAIGDPDVAPASAQAVEGFVRGCGRPVLNDPVRIPPTARDRLGDLLAGLDGVIVPPTVRVAPDRGRRLPAGLAPPLLVRPVASHGGKGLVLANDEASAEQALAALDGAGYATRYYDYRSPDGYYRKYRVIFVDRRPYPYHLAISRHWMVHHDSAGMAGDAVRIGEELDFLRDPEAALGARATAAIAAIGRRLDLDYCGVDFSLTAAGEVLVFEANATMLAHLEPDDGPFAAKNPFIAAILEAFQAHAGWLAAR